MTQIAGAEKDRVNWLWIFCTSPFCGHVRAMPLAPWRIRWGVENPSKQMRRYFRCAACGRKGCEFGVPRRGTGQNGARIGEDEEYPHNKEMRMGQGEARWPETKWEAKERVLKDYLARYPCGDAIKTLDCMCNLYSLRSGQKHITDTARAIRDLTGNMPPYPAIFPNRVAPVVRVAPDGVRELINMR